jgi:tRNA pseudouridine65 synthase
LICDILYRDEQVIAINKPYGYFVHKSSLDATSSKILMKLLRNQIGQFVYPVHRLDRKTSGVLIYALDKESQVTLNRSFEERNTTKEYIAICRGHMLDEGSIDYELTLESGRIQNALTHYKTLQKVEIDLPAGKFPTSRYSLVQFTPVTGRMHQIRKHASHIFHPIIGDRPHGCNKQNRLFLEKFELVEMMLHAHKLSVMHPSINQLLSLTAPFSEEFKRISHILGIDLSPF